MDAQANLRTWLEQRAREHAMTVEEISSGESAAWVSDDRGIRRMDGKFFRVSFLRVRANGREVAEWNQPAIVETDAPGTLGTVVLAERRGVEDRDGRFLVRAIAEPCNPGVEVDGRQSYTLFGPTIQYSGDSRLVHFLVADADKKPSPTPLIELFESQAATGAIAWQRAAGSGGRHRQVVQIGLLSFDERSDFDARLGQALEGLVQADDFRWVSRSELREIYRCGLANHHLRSVSSLLL